MFKHTASPREVPRPWVWRASSCPVPGAAAPSVLGRPVDLSFCTRAEGTWSASGVEVGVDLMMVQDRLTYRLSDIL